VNIDITIYVINVGDSNFEPGVGLGFNVNFKFYVVSDPRFDSEACHMYLFHIVACAFVNMSYVSFGLGWYRLEYVAVSWVRLGPAGTLSVRVLLLLYLLGACPVASTL